jgi:S-adenosylmethionine:tRNA ribosyltransferase-isomerase
VGGRAAPPRRERPVRWTEDIVPLDLSLGDGASSTSTSATAAGGCGPPRPHADAFVRWLERHGRPIHYGYVEHPWPLSAYQNVYADEPGSAEMPSAGRPFSTEVITRLDRHRASTSPRSCCTPASPRWSPPSLPYPERLRVPPTTASGSTLTRRSAGRIVAVGTTVVRGLESAGESGIVEPYDGWTDLVITPERGVRVVDGLLTGWHEPEASHLLMLEAVAGRDLLERSYAASLASGYLWHEFGDEHLILP